ncbi:hypothetical protein ACFL08_03925, partial [Patescibacteria group bacterium]
MLGYFAKRTGWKVFLNALKEQYSQADSVVKGEGSETQKKKEFIAAVHSRYMHNEKEMIKGVPIIAKLFFSYVINFPSQQEYENKIETILCFMEDTQRLSDDEKIIRVIRRHWFNILQ